jgi:outer membrane protein OmpA-like peptidoglycan-associated protein
VKKLAIILLLFGSIMHFTGKSVCGQNIQAQRKMFYYALDHIYKEQYDKALDILFRLDSAKLERFLSSPKEFYVVDGDTVLLEKVYVKYFIANCYLEKKYEKEKTLPYIEFILKSGYTATPDIIYKDLGTLYHLNYQFDKALFYFNKYLQYTKPTDEFYDYTQKMIKTCHNALEIIKDTVKLRIEKIPAPINSPISECKPYLSYDEQVMVFLRISYKEKEVKGKMITDSLAQIMLARKDMGIWKNVQALNVKKVKLPERFDLSGISHDGKEIYLTVWIENQSDILVGKIENFTLKELKPFTKINSPFSEHGICYGADGREIIFSSNRAEGNGGFDLYRITKNAQGKWSTPENLGTKVNSSLDEINPSVSQKRRTVYFSSNGHKTMGGFDIFLSTKDSLGNYETPINAGFPINTTRNNYTFSVCDREDNAYFTGSQFDKYDQQDVFSVYLLKNIPLTFVNGYIKNALNQMPIDAKIRIITHDTVWADYTISHNPKGSPGRYYLFFPPGQNYDLLIESKEFLPQLIRISVPQQDYFYSLHQEISIKPIKMMNKTVGEQVVVTNIFSDIANTKQDSNALSPKMNLKDVEQMKMAIKEIVNYAENHKKEATNETKKVKDYSKLMSFIEESIHSNDTASLVALNNSAINEETYSQTYFYDQDKSETKLYPFKIGNEAVYTTPPLNAFDQHKIVEQLAKDIASHSIFQNLDSTDLVKIQPEIDTIYHEKKKILTCQLLYETGSSSIDPKNIKYLTEIVDLLIDNPKLKIEINGYANSVGHEQNNLELSKERAFTVMNWFLQRKLAEARLSYSYFGEIYSTNENTDGEKQKNRRVDIIVYDTNYVVKYKPKK